MGIGPDITTACHKETLSYKLLHKVCELNRILGMIYATENGHTHLGTWNVGLNENNRTRIRINSVCDTGGTKSTVQYTVLTGIGNGTY